MTYLIELWQQVHLQENLLFSCYVVFRGGTFSFESYISVICVTWVGLPDILIVFFLNFSVAAFCSIILLVCSLLLPYCRPQWRSHRSQFPPVHGSPCSVLEMCCKLEGFSKQGLKQVNDCFVHLCTELASAPRPVHGISWMLGIIVMCHYLLVWLMLVI